MLSHVGLVMVWDSLVNRWLIKYANYKLYNVLIKLAISLFKPMHVIIVLHLMNTLGVHACFIIILEKYRMGN